MRKALTTSLILSVLTLSICLPVSAEEFSGKVVGIIDGDTIDVMHLGKAERIRLHGVDCPEIDQPFGKDAKQYTYTHTFRKTVKVIVHDTDNYGHTVGQVVLPDMSNLNLVLVSAGLAWWYAKHAPEDDFLNDVQENAKAAKRGLWADPNPLPPWEWSKGTGAPTE